MYNEGSSHLHQDVGPTSKRGKPTRQRSALSQWSAGSPLPSKASLQEKGWSDLFVKRPYTDNCSYGTYA